MSSPREAELNEELQRTREDLDAARLEIKLLRQKLDALARRLFGKSSERLNAHQMELLLDGLEEIAAVEAAAAAVLEPKQKDDAPRPRERAPRVPQHLPVKEIIIDPEEVKASPAEWTCIGEEVSELLDYTPGSFTRLRTVRRKYVHRVQRHLPPIIAALPPTLQERCIAAPSLLAHAFVSRYRDHLPWYRIEGIYTGLGVEELLREARAGPDERKATRHAQSRPIIEALHQRLSQLERDHTHLPQSLLGQGIRYALGQWESLLVFLEDGRVEIDNNLVENAIRPTAIGKKNWLFIGDANAGSRAATFYTLIGNCRRHDVNAYDYLKDLFTRLPTMTNWQIKDFTPAAWAKTQRENEAVKRALPRNATLSMVS